MQPKSHYEEGFSRTRDQVKKWKSNFKAQPLRAISAAESVHPVTYFAAAKLIGQKVFGLIQITRQKTVC